MKWFAMSWNDIWNELKSVVIDFEFCSSIHFLMHAKKMFVWEDRDLHWSLQLAQCFPKTLGRLKIQMKWFAMTWNDIWNELKSLTVFLSFNELSMCMQKRSSLLVSGCLVAWSELCMALSSILNHTGLLLAMYTMPFS